MTENQATDSFFFFFFFPPLAGTPALDDPRNNPSVLYCRNIAHWTTDETWQIFFPEGEEVEVVAVGGNDRTFVAAATSRRFLRLYTTNGIALHLFSLEGPVVTMAAKEEQLLVVYQQAAAVLGAQNLGFSLWDIDARSIVARGTTPVSEESTLDWAGFTDSGLAVCADSKQVLRALVRSWGNVWTPLIDMEALKDKVEEKK